MADYINNFVKKFLTSERMHLSAILLFAGFVRLNSLTQPIWPDEALYAQTAKNLYTTGVLTFDGTPWQEHPPLFIFFISLAYLIFGLSELSARVVSPMFGIAGVAATYYLGKQLYNKDTGLIAAFFVAAAPVHWFFSRMMLTDIPLTTLMTITLAFFYKACEGMENRYLITSGVAIALTSMTKKIGIVVYPIILAYLAVKYGNLRWIKDRRIQLMLLLSLALQLPWYVRNYLAFNNPLATMKISPEVIGISSNSLSYGIASLLDVISPPVLIASIPGIYFILRKRRKEDVLAVLPIIAFTLILVLIFLRYHVYYAEVARYLLPAIPFFAIVGASGIERLAKFNGKRYIAGASIFLFSSLLLNLQTGYEIMNLNSKYGGYKEASSWINQNTPENSVIVTNARQAWYYVDRKCTYFPSEISALWSLGGDTYLVIGEWATDRKLMYPAYVYSLPSDRLELEATFNNAKLPIIEIYKVKETK